jgi:lipid II isoglutaminyl synthase (glutamine-hydrolysing)
MIIEVLYSDAGMLFGDRGNVHYLQRTLPDSTFIFTQYPQKPYFAKEYVDLVVIGAMSEKWQLKIIEILRPYQNRIIDMIADDVFFLVTGNALDLFSKHIEDEFGVIHPALNIFDFTVKTNQMKRLNDRILGTYRDIIMVGFKTQFSLAYGNNDDHYFIKVTKGFGFNLESKLDGICYRNFYGTHCIGPLLVLNPQFTKYFVETLTKKPINLPFYDDLMEAYRAKVQEFNDPKKDSNS